MPPQTDFAKALSVLTDGGELEDPVAFVNRLNSLLVSLSDN